LTPLGLLNNIGGKLCNFNSNNENLQNLCIFPSPHDFDMGVKASK
jgi:hypothetical protein